MGAKDKLKRLEGPPARSWAPRLLVPVLLFEDFNHVHPLENTRDQNIRLLSSFWALQTLFCIGMGQPLVKDKLARLKATTVQNYR